MLSMHGFIKGRLEPGTLKKEKRGRGSRVYPRLFTDSTAAGAVLSMSSTEPEGGFTMMVKGSFLFTSPSLVGVVVALVP